MVTRWPEVEEGLLDAKVEAHMGLTMDLIRGIRNRRAETRTVAKTADDLGVDRSQVQMVNGMPVLRVSHSGAAPAPAQIWPGSHFGSREASQHFAGGTKSSHTGNLKFNIIVKERK